MNNTALSLIEQYPKKDFTLLVPIEKTANISEIQAPVISAVKISTNLEDNEIYIQTKEKKAYEDGKGYHPAEPARYALTKKGLNKLASAAGIEKLEPEQLIPSTCQKCAMINQSSNKMAPCGTCSNRDVRYRVTISVPQISGPAILVSDESEINVELKTSGMSDYQKNEYMKTLAGRCITSAYNRAIRAALHIKGTYLIEEFKKPFVVAYLAPNLDNPDVKQAAIESMFSSSRRLFGSTAVMAPIVQNIKQNCEESDVFDTSYEENSSMSESEELIEDRTRDFCCDKCGTVIKKNVWQYSFDKYDRPLCMKCQNIIKREQQSGGGR